MKTIDDLTREETADLIAWINESRQFKIITNDEKGYDVLEGILDEIYGEIKIGHQTYSAGYVLRMIDPIAFDLAFWDCFDDYVPLGDGVIADKYGNDVSFEDVWDTYIGETES